VNHVLVSSKHCIKMCWSAGPIEEPTVLPQTHYLNWEGNGWRR